MHNDAVSRLIEQKLSPSRLAHTLRVRLYAEELALHFGLDAADRQRLESAALIHDLFRDCSADGLLAKASDAKIEISREEQQHPVLLHGAIAAAYAIAELNISDAATLEAIRCHTTGKPGLGLIGTILFIADSLEPGKRHDDAERQRELIEKSDNIEAAALIALNGSIIKQISRGEAIAPDSIHWRNELIKAKSNPHKEVI